MGGGLPGSGKFALARGQLVDDVGHECLYVVDGIS
jgi:hypothetical protein